jgi:UTP:GlnB (protein PII) uridylyltransferase
VWYERLLAAVSSWAEDFQTLARQLKTAEGAEFSKKAVLDLLTRDPVAFYERVDEEGLLVQLFPELEDMKGLEQDGSKHAEGDVDRHNRLIVQNLSKLIERPSPALILAAMFHDVEKRSTKGRDPKTGSIAFHGHAKEGVKTFQSLTRKWDIPDEAADEASWLIGHHVDLFLPHAKLQEYVAGDNKLITKLFVDSPPEWGSDLLHLMHADALSSW